MIPTPVLRNWLQLRNTDAGDTSVEIKNFRTYMPNAHMTPLPVVHIRGKYAGNDVISTCIILSFNIRIKRNMTDGVDRIYKELICTRFLNAV